jgi:predicted DNA-binding transcriptional regulator AlpA
MKELLRLPPKERARKAIKELTKTLEEIRERAKEKGNVYASFTITELAEKASVSRTCIYKHLQKFLSTLPIIKRGRIYMIGAWKKAKLDEWKKLINLIKGGACGSVKATTLSYDFYTEFSSLIYFDPKTQYARIWDKYCEVRGRVVDKIIEDIKDAVERKMEKYVPKKIFVCFLFDRDKIIEIIKKRRTRIQK